MIKLDDVRNALVFRFRHIAVLHRADCRILCGPQWVKGACGRSAGRTAGVPLAPEMPHPGQHLCSGPIPDEALRSVGSKPQFRRQSFRVWRTSNNLLRRPSLRPSPDSQNEAIVMRFLAMFTVAMLLCVAAASAEPGVDWDILDPREAARVAPIQDAVQNYARKYRPTAIVVVQDDRLVAKSGDIARKVNVRSVRKSLLSALFGVAIERGQIDIEKTLEQLGVDDNAPSLTPDEKQATVRQLLMARSGIYHPAAYETREQKVARPPRGAHPPGTFWYYNNWDFNALGAIYTKATGSNVFESFAKLIAGPIGMQDFTPYSGMFIGDSSSLYRAYVFSMSARDLARFGLLFLNKGRWNGTTVIPTRWVAESTKAYSETDRKSREYGYLWWVLDEGVYGRDAILASGYGGQLIAVVPEKRLVVAQVVELDQGRTGIHTTDFLDLVREVMPH